MISSILLASLHRHLIDREVGITLFHDTFGRDVAEEGEFSPFFGRDRIFGATDNHIGLNSDLLKTLGAVLRRLGFEFTGGLQVGNQGQMDEEAILFSDIKGELTDRLHVGSASISPTVPPISVMTTSTSSRSR